MTFVNGYKRSKRVYQQPNSVLSEYALNYRASRAFNLYWPLSRRLNERRYGY